MNLKLGAVPDGISRATRRRADDRRDEHVRVHRSRRPSRPRRSSMHSGKARRERRLVVLLVSATANSSTSFRKLIPVRDWRLRRNRRVARRRTAAGHGRSAVDSMRSQYDFLPRRAPRPRATAYRKGSRRPPSSGAPSGSSPSCAADSEALAARKSNSKEAACSAESGTKELILIAQDTSMWGRDRWPAATAAGRQLLQRYEIDGIEWIRLSSIFTRHGLTAS